MPTKIGRNAWLLAEGERPDAAHPAARGEIVSGAQVLCTWKGDPDDVPLGYWEHMGDRRYVTLVAPMTGRVYMTEKGRVVSLEACVYGLPWSGDPP